MKIEFDAAKDEANQAKHGVSLAAAAEIDLDGAVIFEDLRIEYGERRYIAFAPLNGRLVLHRSGWRDPRHRLEKGQSTRKGKI
jgi:uncharacterized DUF497 family protein